MKCPDINRLVAVTVNFTLNGSHAHIDSYVTERGILAFLAKTLRAHAGNPRFDSVMFNVEDRLFAVRSENDISVYASFRPEEFPAIIAV